MNIYVSNISFRTNEEDLKDLFSKYGTVSSVKIIMDKETNRSRGFGFIEMPTDSEATEAVQSLNGKEMEGRFISVSEAKPREDRGGSRNNSYASSNKRRW